MYEYFKPSYFNYSAIGLLVSLCVYEINGGAKYLTNSQFAKLNFGISYEWKSLDTLLLWNYCLSLMVTVVSDMRLIWIAKTSDEFLVGFSRVRVGQWLVFY